MRRSILLASPILLASTVLLLLDFILGDSESFIFINQEITNPFLDLACAYLSIIFFSLFFASYLILAFISHRSAYRASGIISIISGPVCYGFGSLVKNLIKRPRPFEVLSARVLGLWHTSSFSFPSTTTMLVFGFALPILFEKPRWGAVLTIISSFVGFSVIYTGFHYPGDVIVGVLLSTAITLGMNAMKPWVARLIESKNNS